MSENDKVDQPVEDVETLEPVEIEQADASEGEADEVSHSSQPQALAFH